MASKYETRGVLAGRYRAGQMERVTHTHLVEPGGELALCNKKIELADYYSCSEEQSRARPTCPKCAKRYEKEMAKQKSARDHACSCSHAPKPRKQTKRKPAPKRDALRKSPACGVATEIQTLVLSQQFFNERQAQGWVKRHGFRVIKIDVTPNNYRFRQHSPINFRAGSFRTIRLRPGVEAVIGCPI